jgi:hypothetical protein
MMRLAPAFLGRRCPVRIVVDQVPANPEGNRSFLDGVRQALDTLIQHGRLPAAGHCRLDGSVPRVGAELHFQVLTEREERSAIAIASKEPRMVGPRPPRWGAPGRCGCRRTGGTAMTSRV